MTVSLTLSPEAERLLAGRAAEHGQTLEGFLQELVELEAKTANGRQVQAALAPVGYPRGTQATLDDLTESDDSTPWRGVFAPSGPCKILFTKDFESNISDLPKRQPQVNIEPRWLEDDDE